MHSVCLAFIPNVRQSEDDLQISVSLPDSDRSHIVCFFRRLLCLLLYEYCI